MNNILNHIKQFISTLITGIRSAINEEISWLKSLISPAERSVESVWTSVNTPECSEEELELNRKHQGFTK